MKTGILGLITARGGSKRVPRKNIKNFLGKPLIAWSIETGLASEVFDRFILSTEDAEIADVGRRFGIDVPFVRPAEYATDTANSLGSVQHAFEWMRDNADFEAEAIILLEPPAPGRRPFHIREVAEIIRRDDIDSVLGVTELSVHYHPEKVVKIDEKGNVRRFIGDELIRNGKARGQEYSTLHYPNASIYAFKSKNFYATTPSLWGDTVFGYVMDSKYSFDIDTPEDLVEAERKMKILMDHNEL